MKNNKNQHPTIKLAGNFSFFLTFFSLAWIVYLFPNTIVPQYSVLIAKILLIISSFSVSLFDDKTKVTKNTFSDISIGFGFVLIFISFINPSYNIAFKIILYIILFFGLFGTYRGIFIPISQYILAKSSKTTTSEKKPSNHSINNSFKFLQFFLNILEILAALVTVLQFAGIHPF
ncbi:hypothetical protein [Enterococcus sp. DIV1304_2]|uniref:hypothetical protein n=1 Tax=unclassified Enterococcus TaxID=2608891 RepID=UPI003D3013C5